MRFHSYFNTAVLLIKAYTGSMPLAHYLKNYFAQHKKHGSKDRKYISHLCYCYYRLGHALKEMSIEDRLKTTVFLCNDDITKWVILFDETWLANHSSILDTRITFLKEVSGFDVLQIFPWHTNLNAGIDAEAFAKSHLIQPDLFLRLRPRKKDIVASKLTAAGIPYTEINESCLSLPNNSQVDKIITLNEEAVVQDYSSQQIASFLRSVQLETENYKLETRIWDCCAASGGKSILAYDTFKNINLTVSDIRASIINNLKTRFAEAGMKNYKSFVADLSLTPSTLNLTPFELIICDAPCSGSGTWGRTPEQLHFFTADKITYYTALQQKITQNVLPCVKQSGYFLYITCSVFAAENETMADIIKQRGFTLVKSAVLTGYDKKADTMFAALFKK